MLILRVLRLDKLVPTISQFVASDLGQKYIEPPPFDLEGTFRDSTNTSPLVFILSPGVDPMLSLLKFAEGKGRKVDSISLGQGQGPAAERMLKAGQKEGFWIVLQNCHLFVSWMVRDPEIDHPVAARPCCVRDGLGPCQHAHTSGCCVRSHSRSWWRRWIPKRSHPTSGCGSPRTPRLLSLCSFFKMVQRFHTGADPHSRDLRPMHRPAPHAHPHSHPHAHLHAHSLTRPPTRPFPRLSTRPPARTHVPIHTLTHPLFC